MSANSISQANYIFQEYQEAQRHPAAKSALASQAEEVVERLRNALAARDVKDAFEDTKKMVFNYKLAILKAVSIDEKMFEEAIQHSEGFIEETIDSEVDHGILDRYFVDALAIHRKMTIQLKDQLAGSSGVLAFLQKLWRQLPEGYDAFFLELDAAQKDDSQSALLYDRLRAFYHASIAFDFCMLAAMLVRKAELKLDGTKREHLAFFLKQFTERLAAYAALVGYWTPEDEEETPWIRNIKILVAHLETSASSNTLPVRALSDLY